MILVQETLEEPMKAATIQIMKKAIMNDFNKKRTSRKIMRLSFIHDC